MKCGTDGLPPAGRRGCYVVVAGPEAGGTRRLARGAAPVETGKIRVIGCPGEPADGFRPAAGHRRRSGQEGLIPAILERWAAKD